jgi:hypothetical protein
MLTGLAAEYGTGKIPTEIERQFLSNALQFEQFIRQGVVGSAEGDIFHAEVGNLFENSAGLRYVLFIEREMDGDENILRDDGLDGFP